MKKILILFSFLLPSLLFANGGGIFYYGVNSSGSPYFNNTPEVDILREDLLIRLQGEHIEVYVTYLFNNLSAKKITDLHYAFPVDYWCSREYTEDYSHSFPAQPDETMKENIKRIEFTLNDHTLPYKHETPTVLNNNHEHNFNMRTWYFTTLELPKGISKLTVKYELKSESLSEGEGIYNSGHFKYDFSPAATMGNGKIKEFSMTIDASDKIISDLTFSPEYENDIEEHSGGIYQQTITDFEPGNADPLLFSFYYNDYESAILTSCAGSNDIVLKTSSATRQYPKSNLIDLDFTSAFIFSKKDGIGESLEISALNNFRISSIYMLNGYYKSEETYYDNNRIKKALVELFAPSGKVVDSFTVDLQDIPYQTVTYADFFNSVSYIFGMDYDYFEPEYYDKDHDPEKPWLPGKIRITVLEVYKGNKFDDTCVSELFVTGEYLLSTNDTDEHK